jgi:hypothetical protein
VIQITGIDGAMKVFTNRRAVFGGITVNDGMFKNAPTAPKPKEDGKILVLA